MFQSLVGWVDCWTFYRWTCPHAVLMLDVKVPKTPAGLWKTTETVEVQPNAAVLGHLWVGAGDSRLFPLLY